MLQDGPCRGRTENDGHRAARAAAARATTGWRHGWTSMVGMATPVSRMPIFAYLSDEEAAAAYLYLVYLPPQQGE